MIAIMVEVFIPPALVPALALLATAEADAAEVVVWMDEERETVVTTLTVNGVMDDAARAAIEAEEALERVVGALAE